jgi:hypothetical protein
MGQESLRVGTARDMTQLVRRCSSIASGNVSGEGLRRAGRSEPGPVQPDRGKSLEPVGWTHLTGRKADRLDSLRGRAVRPMEGVIRRGEDGRWKACARPAGRPVHRASVGAERPR